MKAARKLDRRGFIAATGLVAAAPMLALAPGLTRVTLPRVVVARGNDLPSNNLRNRRCDVLRVGIACLPKRSGRRQL